MSIIVTIVVVLLYGMFCYFIGDYCGWSRAIKTYGIDIEE